MGTAALCMMGLSPSQVSCLMKISLVWSENMCFSTAVVKQVKNQGKVLKPVEQILEVTHAVLRGPEGQVRNT